ncbi:MAG: YfhO family protein [Prevotella sp.]|nr:YfhO family protein [Prevotella sp.]
MALAYLPPMIAGVVLAYRGKYLWGLVVTAIFTAFEVNANHVQMTYYYLFIIAAMLIAFIIEGARKKDWKHIGKATAICAAGALIGICLNLSNLYHTWEFSKESMRGKSELVKTNAADQTSSGLDRSYITDYSYGIGETWTLLIPDAKGGTSSRLLWDNEKALKIAEETNITLGDGQQTPAINVFGDMMQRNGYFVQAVGQPVYFMQYWEGNMEDHGTMGPVYTGAFVMFLFVLGLFIVKGPMKWGLLAVTVLSIMLAWGKNFMGLTDLFIDYVPMYAKFRTVESILVIAEFTIPLLAMLSLMRVVQQPEVLTEKKGRNFWLAFALTGGACLLFALFPTMFFSFYNETESSFFHHVCAQVYQLSDSATATLLGVLSEARQAVFTADCWRSLIIIVIGILCLLLYRYGKMRASWMITILAVLCLVDMWQVDKRYLNDGLFVDKSQRENPIQPTYADEQILQDTSLDYRVLNLTSDTFNENETSYFHKSIGGYHAAKLRRYQELITAHIAPEIKKLHEVLPQAEYDLSRLPTDSIMPVLNMLNTKYVIMAVGNQPVPIRNYQTYGNAWLVDKVNFVDNANQELDALGQLALRHEAVADKKFADVLGASVQQDTLSRVTIEKYEPNQLTYTVNTGKGGVVVFSEIYYPGWTATIDGQPAELGRVNYVLRALRVEPGKHEVVLSFFPQTVKTTETIAYISYGVLLLVILLALFFGWKKHKA